ncbi:MAG: hypothetical protein ABI282_07125 [Candidatus Baltobacteraceae bacterium]
METRLYRALVALFAVFISSASATYASPLDPSPAPSAAPKVSAPFVFSGKLRAFDFTRQNASNSQQGGAYKAANQQSFNLGVGLHGSYSFDQNWTVGASYFYANPLGGCSSPNSHSAPPCGKVTQPALNPDDSIPGFTLSTLDEAYLQFKTAAIYGKIGDQTYTTPWANSADTRLKPATFQGADFLYTIDSNWQIQGSDMIRYEPRTSSQFDKVTLITGFPAGNAGPPPNIYVPGGTFLANNGFFYGRIGYTSPQKFAVNLHYYAFDQIANVLWLDARVPFGGKLKPYAAAHFGSEKSSGSALVGKIDASVFGLLGGINVMQNVELNIGFDSVPVRTDNVVLPKGYSCKNGTISGTANSAGGVSLPYFLPSGGTSNCSIASSGTTDIYYGGIASPYTDNYTADPMFTTSLTQGMVERRSPGNAIKTTLTFTSDDKQFVALVSRALYDYNNPGYAQGTYETDFDTTYYVSKLPKTGNYRGFFFRYRYGERTQSGNANIGGAPLFKYNRFQAEYDF